MKKTVAARETADTMHAAEEALGMALQEAKTALARMKVAKVELGMTGTVGDAAIARWAESVQLLDEAWTTMVESHQDAYRALQAVNIRGVAFNPTNFGPVKAQVRAA
jgi:hypothetical protein